MTDHDGRAHACATLGAVPEPSPRGDVAAAYATHHHRVLRLAYLLSGDRHVAEDLAADVFARLWARGCDDVDDVGAYLRRAAVNAANSRWRRLATQRTGLARWCSRETVVVADPSSAIADDLARSDALWQALAALPPRQRTVLVLRYYEDLSEAEIAETLGVGRGTVKSSAARGLARLRGDRGLTASRSVGGNDRAANEDPSSTITTLNGAGPDTMHRVSIPLVAGTGAGGDGGRELVGARGHAGRPADPSPRSMAGPCPSKGGVMPVRILLVDDHAVVRQGLRMFLSLDPDLEVVGEATDSQDALHKVRATSPDVVLMDLLMPVMDGVTAIGAVKAESPEVEVIALTSVLEDELVVGAVQAGAVGYLLKDTRADELCRAIKAAAEGKVQLAPEAAARLVREVRAPERPDVLTERETEVLALLAEGQSNKQIAGALFIGEKTVKTHVSSILSKLGVPSRTAAALHAVRTGLVPVADPSRGR